MPMQTVLFFQERRTAEFTVLPHPAGDTGKRPAAYSQKMNIFEKIRDSYDRLYQGAKGIALFFLAAVIVIITAEILKYTGTIPPAAGTVVQAVFVIAAAVIYIKIEREEEDD